MNLREDGRKRLKSKLTSMTKRSSINLSELGDQVPKRGNWVTRTMGRSLMWLFGWKFDGSMPNITKCVVIGAPHTSNWDFPLAMAAVYALGINFSWLAKHTFVDGPLRPLLIRMGGVSVDRRAASGTVGQAVAQFNGRSQFWLGILPEGTRKKTDGIKLGFYYIAKSANVPILPLTMDYGRKMVGIMPLIESDDDVAVVLSQVEAIYKDVIGKKPQNFIIGVKNK